MEASTLATHAAWVLVVAYGVSLVYEVWRAAAKSHVSRHDSWGAVGLQLAVVYAPAAVVIGLLLAGVPWAAWLGVAFTGVWIVVSVAYYNPVIMAEREPGLIDWVEDFAYTGLLFVAGALLLYDALGWTLTSS